MYERSQRNDHSPDSGGEQLSTAYLAGLRGKVRVRHFNQFEYPFSLFILRTKIRDDHRRNFDLRIDPYNQCIYLRLGAVSILARPDAGYVSRNGGHVFEPYLDKELAPLQVEELAAHFFTMAGRARGDTLSTHITEEDGTLTIERVQIHMSDTFPGPPDAEDFSYWLCTITGAQPAEILPSPGRHISFLVDESGAFLECPADEGWH